MAGGIFSKIYHALQYISHINPDCDNVYLNNLDPGTYLVDTNHPMGYVYCKDAYAKARSEKNVYDEIFDQTRLENQPAYFCERADIPTPSNMNNIDMLRMATKKLKFKQSLLDKIKKTHESLRIDNSFLGIHIRLTDMNYAFGHQLEGIITLEDYVKKIKEVSTPETKLYVASDNHESIHKLKHEFGSKIHHMKNIVRCEKEISGPVWVDNYKDVEYWYDVITDMMMLSKCGSLICRSSNFAGVTMAYSDSIKHVYLVNS